MVDSSIQRVVICVTYKNAIDPRDANRTRIKKFSSIKSQKFSSINAPVLHGSVIVKRGKLEMRVCKSYKDIDVL